MASLPLGSMMRRFMMRRVMMPIVLLPILLLPVLLLASLLMAGHSFAAETITQTNVKTDGRSHMLTGIDMLQRDNFRQLEDQRIGLITNHTGVNRNGVSTVRLLHQSESTQLVALFSPEHGLFGKLDTELIADTRDSESGIKVHSLYGTTRVPTPEMLSDIDTLVFDIQDIGSRFYTYISTMGEAMKAAAEQDVKFVVLDRPNPINGVTVAGPVLEDGKQSFVGFHRLPVRHGMTVGELARLFKAELKLDLELEIIEMEGWQRADYFDQTGLTWINPSPNMRNLTEAILYPGIGLLETTNLSVGRGTDTPFEWIGAPWMDGDLLVKALDRLELPGIEFTAVSFTPDASKFEGELCSGVAFDITNRERFESVRTGLEIAVELRQLYPDIWEIDSYDRLLGNQQVLDALKSGSSASELETLYSADLNAFITRRQNYLIYP